MLFPAPLSVEILLVFRELAEMPSPPGSLPQVSTNTSFAHPGFDAPWNLFPCVVWLPRIVLPPALGCLLSKGWSGLSHRAGPINAGGIELNVLEIAAS